MKTHVLLNKNTRMTCHIDGKHNIKMKEYTHRSYMSLVDTSIVSSSFVQLVSICVMIMIMRSIYISTICLTVKNPCIVRIYSLLTCISVIFICYSLEKVDSNRIVSNIDIDFFFDFLDVARLNANDSLSTIEDKINSKHYVDRKSFVFNATTIQRYRRRTIQ
jgi:hypothetical protein